MFGTRVAFEPYDGSRNRRPNQCWRCQGFFHSSEVCHLSMNCLKCAGLHQAVLCILRIPSNAQIAVESTQLIGGNVRVFQKAKRLQTIKTKVGILKIIIRSPPTKNINQRNQNTAPEVMPSSQNLKHNNQLRSPQSYRTTYPKLPYTKVVSEQKFRQTNHGKI
ncbi:hypothetical protein TNCV_2236951 [Trichonephila clavipes]|nr:hypothetical protein TNCV_2236951 [Trichonephila clavipes]